MTSPEAVLHLLEQLAGSGGQSERLRGGQQGGTLDSRAVQTGPDALQALLLPVPPVSPDRSTTLALRRLDRVFSGVLPIDTRHRYHSDVQRF